MKKIHIQILMLFVPFLVKDYEHETLLITHLTADLLFKICFALLQSCTG